MGLREDALGDMQAGLHRMCPQMDEETEAPGAYTAEPGFQSSGSLFFPHPPQPPAQAQPQSQLPQRPQVSWGPP